MAIPTYIRKYLRMKPEVTQIFEDLEEFRNFVKMQIPSIKLDEAELYKNSSPVWQKFLRRRVNGQPANAPRHNPYYRGRKNT